MTEALGNHTTIAMRRQYAAYHEAGHAVLADYFDVLEYVTIDECAVTQFRSYGYEIQGVILYAGMLAQARYERRSLLCVMMTGGARDRSQVNDVAALQAFIEHCELDKVRQRWRLAAREILLERWPMVQTVAELLMKKGRLTAEEVRQFR
jgi:hypothetical protein